MSVLRYRRYIFVVTGAYLSLFGLIHLSSKSLNYAIASEPPPSGAIETHRIIPSESTDTVCQEIEKKISGINQHLPEARASFIDSEEKLKAFRVKNSVIDPQKEAESLTNTLDRITNERKVLQAILKQDKANLATARQQLLANELQTVNIITEIEYQIAKNQAKDSVLAQTEQQLIAEQKRYLTLIEQYIRLRSQFLLRREALIKLLNQKQEYSLENARNVCNWENK